MNMTTFKPFLLLISLLALTLVSSSVPLRALSKGETGEYVRLQTLLYLDVLTASNPNAGTTSNVSITLGDEEGHTFPIPNLVDWDINPANYPPHVYFKTGQLDNLYGPVNHDQFASKICSIDITITGTGSCPAWGLIYVKVRSNIPVFGKATFNITEWLYTNNNYHVFQNNCTLSDKGIMTGSTGGSLAI